MSLEVYSADELDAWRSYFERLQDTGPYHSPEYITTISRELEGPGAEPELVVFEDGNDFVYYPHIVRPLTELPFGDSVTVDAKGQYDAISSWYYGGPLIGGANPDPDLSARFLEAIDRYSRSRGIVSEFIRFDPNLQNEAKFDCLDPTSVLETVRVDLTQSKSAIWDDFEKRNRNAIRQAQDTDLVVEQTTDPDDYRAFHSIYQNAMEAKGASERYRFTYDVFSDLLSRPTLVSLVVSRYDGEVVGGSMLVHDEEVAHDYLRASNPDYWDLRVNNLLCYRALMHMRETGRTLFDFQGGRPGVFKFKRGFSQSGRGEFHAAERVYLPEVYDDLIEAAGVVDDASYFPAYRAETDSK